MILRNFMPLFGLVIILDTVIEFGGFVADAKIIVSSLNLNSKRDRRNLRQASTEISQHSYRGSEEYGSGSHHLVPLTREDMVPQPEFSPGEDNVEDILDGVLVNATTIEPTDFVLSELKTWSGARETCQNRNGELACLTKTDMDRIVSDTKGLFAGDENIEVWSLGLNCKNETLYAGVEIQNVSGTLQFFRKIFDDKNLLPFYCLLDDTDETTTMNVSTDTTTDIESIVETTEMFTRTTAFETTIPVQGTTTLSAATDLTTTAPVCCEAIYFRGLTWNATCDNGIVVQKCPADTTGNAKWSCDITSAKWFPKTPDLSGCMSKNVGVLLNSLNSSDIPGMYNTLFDAASQSNAGGDVIAIADVLENVTSSLVKPEGNYTDEEWLDMVENVTDSVADIMNSFLNDMEIWTDIPEQERVKAAETLMAVFKLTGFALMEAMNDSALSTHTISKDNVFLQAIKSEKGRYTDGNLSLPLSESPSTNREVILTLTSGFENDIPLQETRGNHTFVLFTTLRNMEDVLVVRGDNSFKNRTENTAVNSAVLSINLVENETVSIPLSNNVTFTVAHKNSSSENPVCAFWDYNTKNWEVDGCWIVDTNLTHTTCACDHLTNFAIIMDMNGALATISESNKRALTVITYIGCIVSIIALAVCVFLTTIVRQMWCIRNTIHRNLSLCLLIAEVFLLTGLERTENKTLCSVVAGCLHYFFLAAFCWMLLESVYIYILLCKVFQPRRSYSERYYLCGYGLPLLIVAISAGANPKGYGTETYCWLSVQKGMTWSFGAPVLIIITINLIALIFALRTAIVISKKKNEHQDEAAARKWIFGALTLVPLLGLTWGVGFLFWKDSGAAGAYIFTILNSFQGLAIFVVQVIMNKKVRDILHRKILGSVRQVAPSSTSRSGTSGKRRTTTTSDGRRSNRGSTMSSSRDRSESAVSKTSNDNFCPDAPVVFLNGVNAVIRSAGVNGTGSYDLTNNSNNNRASDIVCYDTENDTNTKKRSVVLRLKGQDNYNVADTVI